jgi:hypothetical protein
MVPPPTAGAGAAAVVVGAGAAGAGAAAVGCAVPAAGTVPCEVAAAPRFTTVGWAPLDDESSESTAKSTPTTPMDTISAEMTADTPAATNTVGTLTLEFDFPVTTSAFCSFTIGRAYPVIEPRRGHEW